MEISTPVRPTPCFQSTPTALFRSTPGSMGDMSEVFPILRLPHCVLQIVLNYLSYDQVAQLRIVCRSFDQICRRHLNKGFRSVERFHSRCLKDIKAKLPRRESIRRTHPYARHSDILSAIETRISLLSMTFMKYVDMNACCFIPGRVIDEIFRVLRLIKHEQNPPRAYEILQELRDISSMAMEHFDEKIVPTFKLNNLSSSSSSSSLGLSPSKLMSPATFMSPSLSNLLESSSTSSCTSSSSLATVGCLVQEVVTVQHKRVLSMMKKTRSQFASTQKMVNGIKGAQNDQRAKICALEKCVTSQDNLIKCQAEKLKEQEIVFAAQGEKLKETETRLAELSQVMVEYDRKLAEILHQQQQKTSQPQQPPPHLKQEQPSLKLENESKADEGDEAFAVSQKRKAVDLNKIKTERKKRRKE